MDKITQQLIETIKKITEETPSQTKPASPNTPQQIKEDCACCGNEKVPDSEDIETSEVDKLEDASVEDKAEYPGAKGTAAHYGLHKTLDKFIAKMRSMGHK